MRRARQRLNTTHIADVEQRTADKLRAAGIRKLVQPGARIAITAGSRGIGGCNELLKGILGALKDCGAKPFLVPAMGSHGGATAEGQKELLRRLDVDPREIGAEIRTTMETDCLGASRSGAQAHIDKLAHAADGVIVLGRVKTHPENTAGIASGLLKMVTVGLGKQAGAQEAHSHRLWESVKAVPEVTLATGKIRLGVAVVENAFRQPVEIEVVPGNYDAFYQADERLLRIAKQHFANLPFQNLDLLIVDEIGKNVSGTGMDLNVIGPWRVKGGGEKKPDYKRIVALSLTPGSMGNGLGIGLADFTTERFARAYDPHATWINLLTASEPGARNTVEGPLPLALASDREAIEVALYSCLGTNPRVCRIQNTASLHEFWISESLTEEGTEIGDHRFRARLLIQQERQPVLIAFLDILSGSCLSKMTKYNDQLILSNPNVQIQKDLRGFRSSCAILDFSPESKIYLSRMGAPACLPAFIES